MVPTPLFSVILERIVAQVAQHSAGVGQLGAAQVDLVVRHYFHELKNLLPAGDKARAQHVVHAEGLGGRGGRREPRARVRALGQRRPVQRAQRGVNPVEVAAPVRREETVGQTDLVDGEPATLLRLST